MKMADHLHSNVHFQEKSSFIYFLTRQIISSREVHAHCHCHLMKVKWNYIYIYCSHIHIWTWIKLFNKMLVLIWGKSANAKERYGKYGHISLLSVQSLPWITDYLCMRGQFYSGQKQYLVKYPQPIWFPNHPSKGFHHQTNRQYRYRYPLTSWEKK